MNALKRGGEWKKAVALFDDMLAAGLKPNAHAYSALISSMEKGGLWAEALTAFREMEGLGLQPDVHCFTAVIGALSRAPAPGGWVQAQALFQEMHVPNPPVAPSVFTYTALITAAGRAGLPWPPNADPPQQPPAD